MSINGPKNVIYFYDVTTFNLLQSFGGQKVNTNLKFGMLTTLMCVYTYKTVFENFGL